MKLMPKRTWSAVFSLTEESFNGGVLSDCPHHEREKRLNLFADAKAYYESLNEDEAHRCLIALWKSVTEENV